MVSKMDHLGLRYQVSQLNDSVYELYRPRGEPSVEVVFFHGLERGDFEDNHWSTWKCGHGSSIWPQTWLVQKFPDARILSVSYDASVLKSCEGGTIDMHLISQNLTSDLLNANIGQEPCRPVVLVGHNFGGLVIKQICGYASSKTGRWKRNSEKKIQLTTFLENLKAIYFYSTPHQGVFDHLAERFVAEGPLLEYVKTLSTQRARVNFDFDNLCGQHGQYKMWQIAGLGEDPRTKSAMVYGLPHYPTALERRVFEVQQKFANIPVLGIVGMGGIGKTTIAKQIFNNISPQFEYTCFVDNVKGIEVHKLSERVLGLFRRNGSRVDDNALQWSDVQMKKSLIAMDDVDSEVQVRILPRLDEFGSGSQLIFTTRDEGVLDMFPNCAIYEVDFLQSEEAMKLFCHHAFQQEGIPAELIEVNRHLEEDVKKVVDKCAGLPLTLEVVGCYLRGHETNARLWKETLENLGKAQSVDGHPNDRLWSSLRVSYDALSPEEKGMFIEAGTHFFGQPVEIALAAWSTSYGYSQMRWAKLLRTFLVKEVDKTEWDETWQKDIKYKEVWVHDQLRDLGRRISKGAIISMCIGHEDRAVDLLNANATSILQLRGPIQRFQLGLLDKLERLKYLELVHILPEGSSETLSRKLCLLRCTPPIYQQWPLLPISLEDMNNLAVLQLEGWEMPEESLEALGKLSNLRILSLYDIRGPSRLPDNFGNLYQLKRLELTEVRFTALPHSFGNLSALKVLLLSGMSELVELPESFGSLSSLATLVILNCSMLASLPESFGSLSSLATLVILNCSMLASLPESFGSLSSLTDLRIIGCGSLSSQQTTERRQFYLHESLSSLRSLSLEACDSLDRLPASFEFLSSLQELELIGCTRLMMLPESIGEFKSLERLIIKHAERLVVLPESFGNLRTLTHLHLHDCNRLERLPASFGNLSALQELKLQSCGKLQGFPANFGQLRALKEFTMEDINELEALPDDFGNLVSLTLLSLEHCPNLKGLPDSFGLLHALQELELVDCVQLQRLPDSFGQLSSLKILIIKHVDHLQELPDSLGNLCSLEDLYIWADRLQRFPVSIGQLRALEKLTVRAEMLRSFPEELGNLGSLEVLRIEHCGNLMTLPDSLGRMSSLRTVILEDCSALKNVPDSLGKNFCSRGDRSTEMRRPGAWHVPSTEGFGLHVSFCPFLCDSERSELEEFQTEVKNGGRDGYFVSKEWMLGLDKHEKAALMSVLRRTGYTEIYHTDTTMVYERIDDGVHVLTICNDPSCATENNDFRREDVNKAVVSNDSGCVGKIEQYADTAEKQFHLASQMVRTSDFVDPQLGTFSFEDEIQSAPEQPEKPTCVDVPKSLPYKRKAPRNADSNDVLESVKTAVKHTSTGNYSVSNQWISTLSDDEMEDLRSVLSKAGYSQIRQTSTKTYYERLRGHVHSNPTNRSESLSSSQKKGIVGGAESSTTFQRSGSSSANNLHGSKMDDNETSAVISTIQESQKRDVKCPWRPQHLTVSCSPPGTPEPSTSSFSTRRAVGDSYITMPKKREGLCMRTGADKRISMPTVDQFSSPSESSKVSLTVSVNTTFSCCHKSDHGHQTVCIKFSKIEGAVSMGGDAHPQTNTAVLRCVRVNVDACIKHSEGTEDSAEPINLFVRKSDNWRECLRVLETCELLSENGQPGRRDDLVWMEVSPNYPKGTERGFSTTLELQCHVQNRILYDLQRSCRDALGLHFADTDDPVVFEGNIHEDLEPDMLLELNVRYQLVISYNKPCARIVDDMVVVSHRVDMPVDFDCVLEFRTKLLTGVSVSNTNCVAHRSTLIV